MELQSTTLEIFLSDEEKDIIQEMQYLLKEHFCGKIMPSCNVCPYNNDELNCLRKDIDSMINNIDKYTNIMTVKTL